MLNPEQKETKKNLSYLKFLEFLLLCFILSINNTPKTVPGGKLAGTVFDSPWTEVVEPSIHPYDQALRVFRSQFRGHDLLHQRVDTQKLNLLGISDQFHDLVLGVLQVKIPVPEGKVFGTGWVLFIDNTVVKIVTARHVIEDFYLNDFELISPTLNKSNRYFRGVAQYGIGYTFQPGENWENFDTTILSFKPVELTNQFNLLKPLPVANETEMQTLKSHQRVFAIGYPSALFYRDSDKNMDPYLGALNLSFGWLSHGRVIRGMTDLSYGNSGSPVFAVFDTSQGKTAKVIGIVYKIPGLSVGYATERLTNDGLVFFVPVNEIRELLAQQ